MTGYLQIEQLSGLYRFILTTLKLGEVLILDQAALEALSKPYF